MTSEASHVCQISLSFICVNTKFTNITSVLYELHWIPIYKRIIFKLLLPVYRSVNQLTPTYLCELIKPYEEVQKRDDLRSSTQHLLHIPRSGSVSFGDRSFRVAGPSGMPYPWTSSRQTPLKHLKAGSRDIFRQHFGKNAGMNMMNDA